MLQKDCYNVILFWATTKPFDSLDISTDSSFLARNLSIAEK
jgi:hypothetical protein